MISVFFRFIGQDGKPTGYIGYACARTHKELFDVIDEFGDPNSVQLRHAPRFAYCCRVKIDGDEVLIDEHESSENFPCFNDEESWQRPNW